LLASVDDPSRVPETGILPDANNSSCHLDGLGSISSASKLLLQRMFVAYLLKGVLIAIYGPTSTFMADTIRSRKDGMACLARRVSVNSGDPEF